MPRLAACLAASRLHWRLPLALQGNPSGRQEHVRDQDFAGFGAGLLRSGKCCRRPHTEAIHEEVKHAPEVNADETGFGRCGKKRMWLWVAATKKAETFRLLPGRGQAQALDLLGEGFAGFLSRDRWKPYEQFKKALHQLCHGHIRRDFQSMLESGGETGTQGAMLKLASDRAFHLWHQFERGEIDRATLIRLMKPIRAEFRQRLILLRDGSTITKKARGTARISCGNGTACGPAVDMEETNPTDDPAGSHPEGRPVAQRSRGPERIGLPHCRALAHPGRRGSEDDY